MILKPGEAPHVVETRTHVDDLGVLALARIRDDPEPLFQAVSRERRDEHAELLSRECEVTKYSNVDARAKNNAYLHLRVQCDRHALALRPRSDI